MIAAFGDFDVGEMPRRGEDARRQVVVQVRLERARSGSHAFAERHDLVEFVGADERVDFRQICLDIAAVALHQAAGDDQLLRAAGLLVLGHLENGVDGFLLGGVDETAGVDDEDVGLVGMGSQFVALARRAGPS